MCWAITSSHDNPLAANLAIRLSFLFCWVSGFTLCFFCRLPKRQTLAIVYVKRGGEYILRRRLAIPGGRVRSLGSLKYASRCSAGGRLAATWSTIISHPVKETKKEIYGHWQPGCLRNREPSFFNRVTTISPPAPSTAMTWTHALMAMIGVTPAGSTWIPPP